MTRYILLPFLALSLCSMSAQAKKTRILFIGNSYTYVNNLPQVITYLAASMGDTMVFDSHTPGGYSLVGHVGHPTTISKIQQGGWDYVILQEQSQFPAMPQDQVDMYVYPSARKLDSMIHVYSPCANTIFYMTWGRKNGDMDYCGVYPGWNYLCTYAGMDSLLRVRYMTMASDNKAAISPVGPVWHYIRDHYPSIELYQSDESHPSEAGTYAGACAFYTAIFRKSPLNATYNFTLSATDAANIRTAADAVAFDSMSTWSIGAHELAANFMSSNIGTQASFVNKSINAASYNWDFGDGQTSALQSPTHNYANLGQYTVTLVAGNAVSGCSDTMQRVISLFPDGINGVDMPGIMLYPNPVSDRLYISLQAAYPLYSQLTISNAIGQVVLTGSLQLSGTQQIDVRALSPGLYTLIVNNGKQLYRQKLVKR